MKLFRAISLAEYHDLFSSEAFRAGKNSMEGKWFAERLEDAIAWGKLLEPDAHFYLVEVEVDSAISDGFFRIEHLDGIGPARYADCIDLSSSTIISFSKIT
ncbi:MAG: hypothetical protein K9J37_10640 [Saprospiraceae bacterium]|nr:hypothetical protein [Saprospiraceae bacterium]MCF8250362.1 hypothetical protein [Saprospiraceae bacterium]MCF8280401.1 hypothetical protein [Bacteroidales bacterium]MCF8312170.1 hypothetical protein [Saprospiraceae bacterium]MCF8441866.1 hypothetical protein [Saprospiraceae bacterium]